LEVTNVALDVAIEMLDADLAVTLTFEKEMDMTGGGDSLEMASSYKKPRYLLLPLTGHTPGNHLKNAGAGVFLGHHKEDHPRQHSTSKET
jgi:hypothetical protein